MKHGKGIEYYENERSIYVGEFIKGNKSGNGKEFYYHYCDLNKNKLLFEGEYINNYRLRGKEYYENGKLKYEGDYLFKGRWNGKLYDYNGNILFKINDGNVKVVEDKDKIILYIGKNLNEESLKGKVKVKEYDYNGHLLFEGEYLNDERNGNAKEYNDEGQLIFEGTYFKGEKQNKYCEII